MSIRDKVWLVNDFVPFLCLFEAVKLQKLFKHNPFLDILTKYKLNQKYSQKTIGEWLELNPGPLSQEAIDHHIKVLNTTEVASALIIQLPLVRFSAFPKIFLSEKIIGYYRDLLMALLSGKWTI